MTYLRTYGRTDGRAKQNATTKLTVYAVSATVATASMLCESATTVGQTTVVCQFLYLEQMEHMSPSKSRDSRFRKHVNPVWIGKRVHREFFANKADLHDWRKAMPKQIAYALEDLR